MRDATVRSNNGKNRKRIEPTSEPGERISCTSTMGLDIHTTKAQTIAAISICMTVTTPPSPLFLVFRTFDDFKTSETSALPRCGRFTWLYIVTIRDDH